VLKKTFEAESVQKQKTLESRKSQRELQT